MLILPRPAHIYRKIKLNLSANFTLPLVFKKVLDAYDLDLIDYHLKPRGGNRATNIILQTSKGKKLIKKYKESLSRSTIVQEHSILHFLKTVSFPAPRLFTAKTEDTLIECDNHFFAVFDFIESGFQYHHYFLNEKKQNNYIQIAGETLGQLHKELENFIPQGHNPDGFRSKTESRKRDLIWYLEKLERCVNQSPVSKNKNKTNFLLDKSEYLKEEICRCEELLNQAELPRMIIHGDYGPYNLLFQKSGLVYVR
jgi:Ser/Thr protein kinase RdoA (MazF antagonist)